MKKIALIASMVAFPAIAWSGSVCIVEPCNFSFDVKDLEQGAHCQVKDVVLLAKSDADCAKAGGKVVQEKNAAEKK